MRRMRLMMGHMGRMRPMGLMGPMGRMRRMGLMGLMGIMGLMGCSHEDGEDGGGVENPAEGTAIVFRGLVSDGTAVTRATDLEDITETFKVWCYKNLSYDETTEAFGGPQTVMNGFTVNYVAVAGSTPTSSNNWEYVGQGFGNDQTIKFWDWSATAYRFFALANLDGANGAHEATMVYEAYGANETYEAHGAYKVTFTADADDADDAEKCPYYSRLWFSDGNPDHYRDKQFGQPVELVFLKPFAKVRYLFVSGDPDMSVEEMNLQGMEFGPVNSGQTIDRAGEFTVTYPLAGSGTTETWEKGTIGETLTSLGQDERWYTVLPATNQGAYQLTVEVNGVPKDCTVPAEFMNWQPSFEYTYIFKVNEEGGVELGQVYSAYTDWQVGREGTHIVYNW